MHSTLFRLVTDHLILYDTDISICFYVLYISLHDLHVDLVCTQECVWDDSDHSLQLFRVHSLLVKIKK